MRLIESCLHVRWYIAFLLLITFSLLMKNVLVPNISAGSPIACYSFANENSPIPIKNSKIDLPLDSHSLNDKIPHHFHYISISPTLSQTGSITAIDPRIEHNIRSCMDMHLEWKFTVWTDRKVRAEFPELIELLLKAQITSVMSDVIKMNILARFGGIYMDSNFVCLKSFDGLLDRTFAKAFAGNEIAKFDNEFIDSISSAIIGAVPQHNIFTNAARLIQYRALRADPPNIKTGSHFFSEMINKYNTCDSSIYIFSRFKFFPCAFRDRRDCWSNLETFRSWNSVYAVHLWEM